MVVGGHRKTKKKSAGGRRKSSSGAIGLFERLKMWFRLQAKRLGLVILAIFLLPYFMVLVYKVPFIKPVSTLMAYQAVTGTNVDRIWVPMDEISRQIKYSVIAAEDAAFCFHDGVEFGALRRQLGRAISGKSARGGSTITMQTVKNLFLWHGRSYLRKAYEVPLAIWADFIWGKKRTMSWRNSSLLATTLPLPQKRNPAKPSRKHALLAQKIRKRAGTSGAYIGCVKN